MVHSPSRYQDRAAAGQVLAQYLQHYQNAKNTLILALPRGGVPVAVPIAQQLHVPFALFIVRKLGIPFHPELAFGAIASGGQVVYNQEVLDEFHLSSAEINAVIEQEQAELVRREKAYGVHLRPDYRQKKIILVDDGIATGATMRAAVTALRAYDVAHLCVAIPVAPPEVGAIISPLIDDYICPLEPENFEAVGSWYDDFTQITDAQVQQWMQLKK